MCSGRAALRAGLGPEDHGAGRGCGPGACGACAGCRPVAPAPAPGGHWGRRRARQALGPQASCCARPCPLSGQSTASVTAAVRCPCLGAQVGRTSTACHDAVHQGADGPSWCAGTWALGQPRCWRWQTTATGCGRRASRRTTPSSSCPAPQVTCCPVCICLLLPKPAQGHVMHESWSQGCSSASSCTAAQEILCSCAAGCTRRWQAPRAELGRLWWCRLDRAGHTHPRAAKELWRGGGRGRPWQAAAGRPGRPGAQLTQL